MIAVVAAVVWVTVAVAFALTVGRGIRIADQREQQVPR